ncbi:ABC transporter substrate-binding protein [Telmatospirillum sp.]|uniref:MlaC/ttg2D family ABC transporter substrate-binding protein n=1 Tax=Telmatospirillum sp. TaxID=2079197 RepID=UPI002844CA60|nr:ABC transporter substrate-binding protein [Telmatospirillum sp.]MDR3435818.1 ABC transporter substrate-binding protein [Telmatospirillum sp.]
MMFRRTFLKTVLVLALAVGAFPGLGHAQTGDAAQKFITSLAQKAITTVADRQLSQSDRDDRFRKLFVSAFDIPEIGRFVLSRSWRTATPEQQQEFLGLFEEITVLTWSKRFQDYNGESLETVSATKDGDRNWFVDSHILRAQGTQIPVQWRLKEADDGSFHVIDIVVEGVSMAITHRSDYAAALQANGGRVDGLLTIMRTKLDQLKAAG